GRGAEPLPHVTLVEAGARGQLRAGGRALGGRLEEAVAVTELDHQREDAARIQPEDLAREFLDTLAIELGTHARPPAAVGRTDCRCARVPRQWAGRLGSINFRGGERS